jgi:3-deoxy-D-manno-octulosonic-acid transferase
VSLFSYFYFFVSIVLYIVALPLLLLLSFKPKYKESIPARFFLRKNSKFTQADGVWFHVCSLGEARALKSVLKLLNREDVSITTITHTGYAEAKRYNADVRYLPYEMFLPFWMKKQKVLVILEAEFWFMLIVWAHFRGTKVYLLNARISEKSAKRYLQFAWFYKKMLDKVEVVYAQSEADKNRFLALGARNIEVIGNIKLAGEIVKTKSYLKPNRETIVAASTHDGEELLALKAYIEYKKQYDATLFVVPRHPERFESVYQLIESMSQKHDLRYSRFSETQEFESDIVLVDAMGELNNIYAISDITILGGAFKNDVGGHNPLEPAFFGCKIITGKHFFHQKELFKYVHHVQYVEGDAIHRALLATHNLPESMVEEKINLEIVIDKIQENL